MNHLNVGEKWILGCKATCGWFVQVEDEGVSKQRNSHAQPALHATAERAHRRVGRGRQGDLRGGNSMDAM